LRRPVLIAIKFNDETGLKANEICDIGADGLLPPELEVVKSTAAECEPQFALNSSLFAAKLFGQVVFHDTPHPSRASPTPPSPTRGEGLLLPCVVRGFQHA
jgi:hypothetical protein